VEDRRDRRGRRLGARVTKLDLGPIGVTVAPAQGGAFLDATIELEALGYSTIWLSGGPLRSLARIREVVDATRDVKVASGIISVDRFDAATVATAYAEIEAAHPGRFVVGLGGAHGPEPLRTLAGYLDTLDSQPPSVPATARILAALGPRMLRLARDRTAGAYPFMVTPDYTARARSLLGEDATLVVGQFAIVDTDPARARDLARGPLRFMTARGGGYAANLRRMGFGEDEIAQLSDRLVDAVVARGDLDAVAARISEQLRAGADQVAISVLSQGPPGSLPIDEWRGLASASIP
jgi:probable F420-dependent oxidoreductase